MRQENSIMKFAACVVIALLASSQTVHTSNKFVRTLSKVHYNPGCPTSICPPVDKKEQRGRFNFFYIRSASPHDVIHYLVSAGSPFASVPSSTSFGVPTVFIIQSNDVHSQLAIDWSKLNSGKATQLNDVIKVNGSVSYSASLVITRLLEYRDKADEGEMSSSTNEWNSFSGDDFDWQPLMTSSPHAKHDLMFELEAKALLGFNSSSFSSSSTSNKLFADSRASFKLRFYASATPDRQHSLSPHLRFGDSASNLIFDVRLDRLNVNWKESRFGVELAMTSQTIRTKIDENEANQKKMSVFTEHSLDDEYSPGIFNTINFVAPVRTLTDSTHDTLEQQQQQQQVELSLAGATNSLLLLPDTVMPNAQPQLNSSFLQWKPVCYVSPYDSRMLNDSKLAYSYPLNSFTPLNSASSQSLKALSRSAAALWFAYPPSGGGGDNSSNTASFSTAEGLLVGNSGLVNVSFGSAGDKFYVHRNATLWTASFGAGKPPKESISTAVLLAIIFGLGIPLLAMLFGSGYVVYKRVTLRSDGASGSDNTTEGRRGNDSGSSTRRRNSATGNRENAYINSTFENSSINN